MAVMITAIVGTDMQTMRQGRVVITSLLMASLLTADQNVSIELVQGSWVVPERPWSARFSAGIMGAHHGVHRRYWPGKQGEQMRSIPVDGSWINMSIAQIQPLTHTRGDIERHGDALKAVRLDDTSCIVFLDVSLYRRCIDRYIML